MKYETTHQTLALQLIAILHKVSFFFTKERQCWDWDVTNWKPAKVQPKI
jgi:hypothetical protein